MWLLATTSPAPVSLDFPHTFHSLVRFRRFSGTQIQSPLFFSFISFIFTG